MAKINNAQVAETPSLDTTTLEQMVLNMQETMRRQAEEINQLKGQGPNKYEKAKERFTGPAKANYRLRHGVPVISVDTQVKKNVAQDFLYKDPMSNAYIDNQYFDVTLADGTTEKKILGKSFNDGVVKSDKIEFGAITVNGDRISRVNVEDLPRIKAAKYIFNVDGKEMIVDSKCIN